jgi:hypothetical protein
MRMRQKVFITITNTSWIMAKVTQSFTLTEDDYEIICEVRRKQGSENNSKALHVIIRSWQGYVEERQKIRELQQKIIHDEKRKAINPLVNP